MRGSAALHPRELPPRRPPGTGQELEDTGPRSSPNRTSFPASRGRPRTSVRLRMLRPEDDAGVAGRGLGAAADGGAGEVAGAPRLESVRRRRSPRTPRAGGRGEEAGAVRDGNLRGVTSARAGPVRGRKARRGRDEGGRRRRAELPAPTRACALATAEGGAGTRASAASAPAPSRLGARAGDWRRSSSFSLPAFPGFPPPSSQRSCASAASPPASPLPGRPSFRSRSHPELLGSFCFTSTMVRSFL